MTQSSPNQSPPTPESPDDPTPSLESPPNRFVDRASRVPTPSDGPRDAPSGAPIRRAAFLDRDDTLIRRADGSPTGDLGEPDDIELIPGAADALATLRDAGFLLVVFTNQGGVARGRYTASDVHAVHQRLDQLLLEAGLPPNEHGLAIDAWRFCPFHPQGTVPEFTREHPWRKPAPGMILDASDELGADLGCSIAIGDQPRDLVAATAAGIPRDHCRLITPNDTGDWPTARTPVQAVEQLCLVALRP